MEKMENLLSAGALTQILDGQKPAYPVLQIIGYKPMDSDSTNELRYRLMIGDGTRTYQYCVVTNQDLVQDIQTGKLEKWSVIRANSYSTVDVGDTPETKRRLIYLLNLEVIKKGSDVGKKLVATDTGDQVSAQNLPPPAAAAMTPLAPTQPQPYPMNGSGNGVASRQPAYQQQNFEQYRSPSRPMRNSHENQCIGIGELTPYVGKWVVKGRVTAKSAIRTYNNAKGEGKLFNFSMSDKTGEIKITAFNADCERVFSYVEPNKVYVLGRASVKNADKRYTTADFEITLNSDSLLEEITDIDAAKDIPLAKFNFVSIASLSNSIPTQPVDLIGAIMTVSDVSTIMSRTKNKELKKRNITIVDKTRSSLGVTLWGEQAETFTGQAGDVFVSKACRIGSYGGCSASAGDCVFLNPDLPEARSMKNWYANLLDQNFTSLTNTQDSQGSGDQWKTIAQMTDIEQVRAITSSGNQSALYSKCKAMLMAVGRNPVYKCCPTEGCGKKLVDTQNGELKCEKCQQTYTNFKFRYKTDVEIMDHSSASWVTLWDEKAENLFQMKPEEMEMLMRDDNKKEQYEKTITKPTFKEFLMTLRSRIDTYNQEERVKLQVVQCAPLDTATYTKRVMDEIKTLQAM